MKKLVQTWSSWNYLEQSLACESLNACNINLNLKENLAFKKCVKKSFMSLPEEIIVSKDSALLLSFSKGLLILTKESSTYYCITWGSFINHVVRILGIFDPLSLRGHFY